MNQREAGWLGWLAAKEKLKKRTEDFRSNYLKNPKKCFLCFKSISFERRENSFCNRSCSTTYNNTGVRRHGRPPKQECCNYCDGACTNKRICGKKRKIDAAFAVGTLNFSSKTQREYIRFKRGHRCEKCNRTEWLNEPIPLVLDHINGNSEDNKIANLRIICNNCDALSPTFKGRNKGKGRLARKLYRAAQKEKLGFYC